MRLRSFVLGYIAVPLGILFGCAWLFGWVAGRIDKNRRSTIERQRRRDFFPPSPDFSAFSVRSASLSASSALPVTLG